MLMKEEGGDLSELEERKITEEKVDRLEIFVDKFGSFLKQLKVKVEIGKAGYERVV